MLPVFQAFREKREKITEQRDSDTDQGNASEAGWHPVVRKVLQETVQARQTVRIFFDLIFS